MRVEMPRSSRADPENGDGLPDISRRGPARRAVGQYGRPMADGPNPGPALDDGVYDVLVFDAADRPDGGSHLEFTITAGAHRGVVLSVGSSKWMGDPAELIGMPGTLTVSGGAPSITIDR